MTKKWAFVWLFWIPVLTQAQITVSVMPLPAGMIPKEQLWNLALASNYSTTYDVYVYLTLQDAVTGQSVLSAGTRSISVPKGVKMLQPRDVQPVQYNSTASGFDGSFLPLGSYIACYTITRIIGDGPEEIARECVRINVSPLSPPLLTTPEDRSTITLSYPQFTWMPPTPLNMFDNLQYDISVAEVQPGQSPGEAILYNSPLYVSGRLKQPYTVYPSTYARLEPGKTYAWQVTARNSGSYAAATEAWTFTIGKDSTVTVKEAVSYLELKGSEERAGISYIKGNTLYIKYYSYDQAREAVVSLRGNDKQLLKEIKQQILYGDNFLTIPLGKQFDKGSIYQIQIKDLKNNLYTATFGIQ